MKFTLPGCLLLLASSAEDAQQRARAIRVLAIVDGELIYVKH